MFTRTLCPMKTAITFSVALYVRPHPAFHMNVKTKRFMNLFKHASPNGDDALGVYFISIIIKLCVFVKWLKPERNCLFFVWVSRSTHLTRRRHVESDGQHCVGCYDGTGGVGQIHHHGHQQDSPRHNRRHKYFPISWVTSVKYIAHVKRNPTVHTSWFQI